MLKNLSMLSAQDWQSFILCLYKSCIISMRCLILFHITILQNLLYPLFPLAVANLTPPGSRQIGDCVSPMPRITYDPSTVETHAWTKVSSHHPKSAPNPPLSSFLPQTSELSVTYRREAGSVVTWCIIWPGGMSEAWSISFLLTLGSKWLLTHFRNQSVLKGSAFTVCRDTLFVKVPTNVEFSSSKGKPKIFVEQKEWPYYIILVFERVKFHSEI